MIVAHRLRIWLNPVSCNKQVLRHTLTHTHVLSLCSWWAACISFDKSGSISWTNPWCVFDTNKTKTLLHPRLELFEVVMIAFFFFITSRHFLVNYYSFFFLVVSGMQYSEKTKICKWSWLTFFFLHWNGCKPKHPVELQCNQGGGLCNFPHFMFSLSVRYGQVTYW